MPEDTTLSAEPVDQLPAGPEEDDLRHLALSMSDRVLDVGCGSGSVTRVIARAVSNGRATGVDREPTHLDFARRKAAAEGIGNIQFDGGDALRLPFVDGRFDVVWSKHLLQFVRDRQQALAEFKRVCRPGGRVVCCNYDYFCVCLYPVDPELQADVEVFSRRRGENSASTTSWAGNSRICSCKLDS